MKLHVCRSAMSTVFALILILEFASAQNRHSRNCNYWCERDGELICCDNEGTCPPVRDHFEACRAPPGSVHHPSGHDMVPRHDDASCLDDKRCFAGEKCCYDRCLDKKVCKGIWERRREY